MAHFAILRTQKAQVRGRCPSLHEAQLQAQDTPNADAELAHHNEHFGAHSVAEGMAAFRARLPESFRKDAVQAIEYLMTASPESDGQQEPGRAGCVFPGRAGLAEEVAMARKTWSMPASTGTRPRRMYAYVVPRDPETGRLNARGGWVVPRRCGTCKPSMRSRSASGMA